MHVLLDLYGVLLEHEKTFRGYRERLAALLAARFGGDADAWRRAHDEAFVTYTRRANEADWDARGYGDVVDELDARHLLEMARVEFVDHVPVPASVPVRFIRASGVGHVGLIVGPSPCLGLSSEARREQRGQALPV